MSRLVLLALALPVAAHANSGRGAAAGGLPQAQAELAVCAADLDVCAADLDVCFDELDAYVAWCEAELDATCDAAIATPGTGGLARSADGGATVIVPPGAVREVIELAVERVERPTVDAQRASAVYDFTPDGATFAEPATVCLDTTAKSREGVCLGYLDESTKPAQWRCEDTCLESSEGGVLCGSTSHFTNFAILLSAGSGKDDDCDSKGSYVLGRTGGVVVSADTKAFVSVPPGALAKDTQLAVVPVAKPVVDAPRATGVYDFGPGAHSFRAPVTVCFTADAGAAQKGCLGYLDETKSPPAWVCEDPCLEETSSGTVCGKTDHFTKFALLLGGASSTCDAR